MLLEHFNTTCTGKRFARAWIVLIVVTVGISTIARQGFAAIGCTLSNPAADLKYLYPEMTTYKEDLKEFTRLKNGEELFKSISVRLGSDLDPIYETFETPYTVYSVFKGEKKIGVVHGVNVPGKGGVIQVFLSVDPDTGKIHRFFFQRLESLEARQLRSQEFRAQFEGLTLADFYKHDYYSVTSKNLADSIGKIKSKKFIDKPEASGKPESGGRPDFDASIRGVRKNLILLDFFVYGRRFEPFFKKAQQALLDKNKLHNTQLQKQEKR